MKTKTIITDLTQEDLVDLLCTATYGSSWLDCSAPERSGIELNENDCREDVWAKSLLAGHKLKVYDYYAEGEKYGNLGCVIKEDGTAVYFVGLKEIRDGLQKCADGDAGSWCATAYRAFREGEGEMDNPMAEMLMQIILFGELIYG